MREVDAREVRVYEVGPRDGLQSEATVVPTDAKLRYIDLLAAAGLREIEATSFVSPRAIPALADADQLMPRLPGRDGIRYPVLVPNQRGLERAAAAGADAIAVFTAATESYARANINQGIEESLGSFAPLVEFARAHGWWVRGYVSTAFGCPYEGEVDPAAVVLISERLLSLGIEQLAISDTIGVATPADVKRVLGALAQAGIGPDRLAMHFHDTRGTALANVMAAMEHGVRCFDSAAGGIGGSPYAPGSAGNLATEDLVYLLDRQRIRHGVDLDGVLEAARFISRALDRPLETKVGRAGAWHAEPGRSPGPEPQSGPAGRTG
jgi:hydroxymethylglutaryl-CoA lyase